MPKKKLFLKKVKKAGKVFFITRKLVSSTIYTDCHARKAVKSLSNDNRQSNRCKQLKFAKRNCESRFTIDNRDP